MQLALLAFGLFALAALIVDLGLARAAQAAMQTAADGAALEGVRLRDDLPADPIASDAQRRAGASTLVQNLFDDDLLLATPNTQIQLGAGPQFSATTAGPLVVGASPTFVPALELNLGNALHGDLVAGAYDPDAVHSEAENYVRNDFAPASGGAEAAAADAFLVRLRRTHDPLGLDAQAGVSSSGPGVPLLFGLGSLVQASADYDPRTDGITVRATSVAEARPALRVGTSGPGWLGLTTPGRSLTGEPLALAFELSNWTTCWPTATPCADVPMQFDIEQVDGVVRSTAGVCAGQAAGALLLGAQQVGDISPQIVSANLLLAPDPGTHYVAIYRTGDPGPGAVRVVGFGAIEVQSATPIPGGLQIVATKLCSFVAPQNASPRSTVAVAALATVAGFDDAHQQYVQFGEPLLAPALVR